MEWFFYAVACPATLFVLALAACVLHWASKHGQVGALWRALKSLVGDSAADRRSENLVREPEPPSRPSPQL